MRTGNLNGRAVLVHDDLAIDIAEASRGHFGPDPQRLFGHWDELRAWADAGALPIGRPFSAEHLGPPVPRPRQIFAIGVNYAAHAAEAGYLDDSVPVTFTKFASCLTGPVARVELPSAHVDWEVELVVVVGRQARGVDRSRAWDHVAGLTVGQDLSERHVQMIGPKPQFSLGKSFAGFGPIGPYVVTPDELADPDDLAIACRVGDEVLQQSRTSRMIYDVPELLARLSAVCVLYPGDLIFSGTPDGVGNARDPKRFLGPDDVLVSEVEGLGSLTTSFIRGATWSD